MTGRTAKLLLSGALAVTGILAAAPAASASFHAVQIREVHNGADTITNSDDYVVLQMYAPGQNLFLNHYVSFWNQDQVAANHTITANGALGLDQSTFLLGNTAIANADDNGVGDQLVYGTGGAACYEEINAQVGPIDCVSWGNFTGAIQPTSGPSGTPAATIPVGGSLVRSIARGCATLLEPADDTNNSAADFALGTPNARNSSTPPIEQPCAPAANPGTTLVRRRKCKKKASKKSLADAAKKGKKKCKRKKKKK